MNKKEFVSIFQIEDKNLIGNLYEKYKLALDTDMKVYTEEFYPPLIWTKLTALTGKLGVRVEGVGYFEYAERRRIAFVPMEEEYYEMEDDKIIVKLKNKSSFKKLQHKDYLGAIMSLGIKREVVGDLVVDEDACYFVTNSVIAGLIEQNLTKAGKNPLEFETLEEVSLLPQHHFLDLDMVMSSMRLDSVVAALGNMSRKEAVEKIEKKEVALDYQIRDSKSMPVKEGNIISIRKAGKYIIEGEMGRTKKDRIKVRVRKFV